MSGLRAAAERIERMGRFVAPSPDRRLECEKAAERLVTRESGTGRNTEPWDDFLRRLGLIDG